MHLPNVQSFGAQLGSLAEAESSQGPSRPLFTRVSFQVRCETEWGETVAVVGDVPQLGAWEPVSGVRMMTTEELYPVWNCEPLLLSESVELEYKFVVLGPSNDAVRWEPLPNNRKARLDSSEIMVVADWGSPNELSSMAGGEWVAAGPPHDLDCSALSRSSMVPTPHMYDMPGASSGQSASASSPTPGPCGTSGVAFSLDGECCFGKARAAETDSSLRNVNNAMSSPLVERLIVVQQHLPYEVYRQINADGSVTWRGAWDEFSLLATPTQGGRHLMGSLNIEVMFVGCLKQHIPPEHQDEVRSLLAQQNCVPVFLSEELYHDHCHGYATTVLFPLLHNQMPDRHRSFGQQRGEHISGGLVPALFQSYSRANEAFAAVVKSTCRDGDMIWAHSYPLLLLPEKLRLAKLPLNCVISFFLHTPFPSPEVWRALAHRTQLLNGMLASHVVGFHLFEYARHFMTSCRRLLGLGENVGPSPAGGVLSIDVGSRRVTITVSHVGLDRDTMCYRLKMPEVLDEERAFRSRCELGDRTVIGGVEKLNALQGTALKLAAYELLLKNYPMWRSRLTLLQICLPERTNPDEATRQSAENRATVKRIQTSFGVESVHYMEVGSEIAFSEWNQNMRLAVFCLIDVLLNCAMKDGLNLLPFEFVLTKSIQKANGVVVLSEFVGCSHVLNGGMRVNPFNLEHVVEQLDAALSMPPAERAARLAKDYKFVSENTTTSWLDVAVQDMRRVRMVAMNRSVLTGARPTRCLCWWPSGVGIGFPIPKLSSEAVLRAYRQSTHRLILLGLDGTLIQQEKVLQFLKNFQDFQGHSLPPPPAALHCLRALASDALNSLFVISGRSAHDLETCLGSIAGLGLAAELGFMQRLPGDTAWQTKAITESQAGWHDVIRPILDQYTMRTNGTYLRWQESAVFWCYQNADPDFGRFQARQLTIALKEKLKGAGIIVSNSSIKGRVEVRIAGINKGIAADEAFIRAQTMGPVDFVMCIGDDDEDEYMLSAITARASGPESITRLRRSLFTVTVGAKPNSHAQFLVENSRDVLALLETIRDGHRH